MSEAVTQKVSKLTRRKFGFQAKLKAALFLLSGARAQKMAPPSHMPVLVSNPNASPSNILKQTEPVSTWSLPLIILIVVFSTIFILLMVKGLEKAMEFITNKFKERAERSRLKFEEEQKAKRLHRRMTKALKRRETLRQQALNDEEALLAEDDSVRSQLKDHQIMTGRAIDNSTKLPEA